MIRRTYPMVAVAYIPKSIYNTDNAFIDGKIAQNIANIITKANWQSLGVTLKTENIYAEVGEINTNRHEVWASEYRGVEFAARLDHVYVSVEFDLVVEASEDCLQNYDCNDESVTVEGDTIVVELSDPSAWHKDGDFLSEIKQIGSLNAVNWQLIHGGAVKATVTAAGLNIPAIVGDVALTGNLVVTGSIDYTSGAIQSLNGLTAKSQVFAVGSSGTDLNIVSSGNTHTFNIPDASALNRGLVTTGAQTFAGAKTFNLAQTTFKGAGTTSETWTAQFHNYTGTSNSWLLRDDGHIGAGTSTLTEFINFQKDQNQDTVTTINNYDTGTSARSLLNLKNAVSVGNVFSFVLTGVNYAGISGWTNRGIIATNSSITGGILIRPTVGGVQVTTDGSNNNPNLFMGANGYVSIGHTGQTYNLDVLGVTRLRRTGVNGAGLAGVTIIASDARTTGDGIVLFFRGQNSALADKEYGRITATITTPTAGSENGNLTFRTTTNGSATDKAILDYQGNFGLGVTTTSARLHAVGADATTANYVAKFYGFGLTNGPEIRNDGPMILGRLAADPANPINGMIYYNTTTGEFRGYKGGVWVNL